MNQMKRKKQKITTSISLKISNSNTISNENRDATNNNTSTTGRELIQLINKPDVLADSNSIEIWLNKMETFLKTVEKEHWYDITISYIDNKFIKEMNLEKDSENPFEKLKKQLMKIVKSQQLKDAMQKLDFKTLGDRKQNHKESIQDYGNNLIEMAMKLFPHANLEIHFSISIAVIYIYLYQSRR